MMVDYIPYGHQDINQQDIDAVIEVYYHCDCR
jgi:hypothetical protein